MKYVSAIACALALLGCVATSAQAADHEMYTLGDVLMPWQDPAGHMWFNEYGDVVTLCDNEADGLKVILHVALDDPYNGEEYTSIVGGEGRCVTRKAAMGGHYNLPENRKIGFLLCHYPDGYCNANTWLNDH
jgi:hypothetical protein